MSTSDQNPQPPENEREKARREREITEVPGSSDRSGSGNSLGDGSSNDQGRKSQES
ncbi:hypothetical protein [Caballeronia sp. Lep1P3]|uniref:hypothetical protein n=1 Tax=Caballeronia sp. Lep1P3 TaxID=2878150 RepID=UPI001FD46523|nr:hypothetical protein [Caballeronia sp. Lep1P3]